MNLVSNFKDYYDFLSQSQSDIKYIRNINSSTKVDELNTIRNLGVKTIELKPVSHMLNVDKVVVYTDITKHCGCGKVIMDLDAAKLMYPSKLCSKFMSEVDYTYKLLQIGRRTFRCAIKNVLPLKVSKDEGDILVQEISGIKIEGIDLPIYSIDYIKTTEGMLACDFNTVERLDNLYMNKHITAHEVVEEIEKILIT